MLRIVAVVALTALPSLTYAYAQAPPRHRIPTSVQLHQIEALIRQAGEQLASVKRLHERDVRVLRHLRNADTVLTDPMQPHAAVQKAFEEVGAAEGLQPDFVVAQGLIRVRQAIELARRSPASADFERLRSLIRSEAVGPASRIVVLRATALHEETVGWLKVQDLVGAHLRELSAITSESLAISQ